MAAVVGEQNVGLYNLRKEIKVVDLVQRDLYSAFLLMNSSIDGECTDRMKCNETFEEFKELHDVEVKRIEQLGFFVLNSGIYLKKKKATAVAY